MTTLPPAKCVAPQTLGPLVVFAVVYLAALAVVFAPEGSLSSRAPTDMVTGSR